MIDGSSGSRLFEDLIRDLLQRGLSVRFQARGASMSPAIRDGEIVQVTPVIVSKLRKDDIVLTKSNYGFRVHRLVIADHEKDAFVTRGDCGLENDPVLRGDQILGIAEAKEVRIGRRLVRANFKGSGGQLLRGVARGQRMLLAGARFFSRAGTSAGQKHPDVASTSSSSLQNVPHRKFSLTKRRQGAPTVLGVLGLLCVLMAAPQLRAQVAVDATTSGSGNLIGVAN